MGSACCCCKGDSGTASDDEAGPRGRAPPDYPDFIERTQADWKNTDEGSIARDLPRMQIVFVREGVEPERVHSSPTSALVIDSSDAAQARTRYNKLKDHVVGLVELLADSDDRRHLKDSIAAQFDAAVAAGADSPDMSGALSTVLTNCHITRASAAGAAGGGGAPADARVALYRVMSLFAQGIVFFAAQRVAHSLYLSWAPHLRDVSWTIYVSSASASTRRRVDAAAQREPTATVAASAGRPTDDDATYEDEPLVLPMQEATSQDPSSPTTTVTTGGVDPAANEICVAHVQRVRNYVSDAQTSVTPLFEVEWAFRFFLDSRTGEWLDAQLAVQKICVMRNTKWGGAPPAWKRRRKQLEDLVFSAWSLECIEVDKF